MTPRISNAAKALFRRLFGPAIDAGPDRTVQCDRCGTASYGDDPPVPVVCAVCLERFRDGVTGRDGLPCCASCLHAEAEEDAGVLFNPDLKPIVRDSYPDGYTCEFCGDSFEWKNDRAKRNGEDR